MLVVGAKYVGMACLLRTRIVIVETCIESQVTHGDGGSIDRFGSHSVVTVNRTDEHRDL